MYVTMRTMRTSKFNSGKPGAPGQALRRRGWVPKGHKFTSGAPGQALRGRLLGRTVVSTLLESALMMHCLLFAVCMTEDGL